MMAEESPTVFGRKATEQIAKTVREVSRRMMLPRGQRGRWQNNDTEIVVVLNAALAVATNSKTGATSCLAAVCYWSSSNTFIEITPAQTVTVYNHSESTAHAINTFGVARWICGHWMFFGDCAAMASRGS